MIAQLLISVDAAADRFLAQVDWSALPEAAEGRLLRLVFAWADWLGHGSLDLAAGADRVRDEMIRRVQNLTVHTLDMVVCRTAGGGVGNQALLEIYPRLEQAMNTLPVRRLWLLYAPNSEGLRTFLGELRADMASLTSPAAGLAELVWVPAHAHGQPAHWPVNQTRVFATSNGIPIVRQTTDTMLATCALRTRNAQHFALVFDRPGWWEHGRLHATLDLTAVPRLQQDPPLDEAVKQFAARHRLTERDYQQPPPTGPEPALDVTRPPAETEATQPALRRVEELESRMAGGGSTDETVNAKRLEAVKIEYEQALAGLLEQHGDSLEGYRRALYFHERLTALLLATAAHQTRFWEAHHTVVISLTNGLIHVIQQFCPDTAVDVLGNDADQASVLLKLRRIRERLLEAAWPREWHTMPPVLLALGDALTAVINDWRVAVSQAGAVTNAARPVAKAADALLAGQQAEAAGKLDAIAAERPAHDFLHLKSILIEPRRKREARKRVEAALAAWEREWKGQVAAFLELVAAWSSFERHLAKAKTGLDAETALVLEGGSYLTAFAQRLESAQAQAAQQLDQWPAEAWESDAELSYLGSAELEELYRVAGPFTQTGYLGWLHGRNPQTREMRRALEVYVTEIDAYALACYEGLSLDLPALMFARFPNLALPRVRRLVKRAAEGLVPLRKQHSDQRRLLMCWGFAEAGRLPLERVTAQCGYEQERVSLQPTQVLHYTNGNRDRLDLVLSVCGFRFDDYQYYEAFAAAGTTGDPPPELSDSP